MKINDWELYCTSVFDAIFTKLINDVEMLRAEDPLCCFHHEKAKLLKRVYLAITDDVPCDPIHSKFNLGKNTLGKHRQAWKRVKSGLPDRYRLFFKRSTATHIIVYAWVNNKDCLRKAGAKTDVYRVFKTMLRKGEIAEDYDALLLAAIDLEIAATHNVVLR